MSDHSPKPQNHPYRQGKITGYESKQTTHYSIVDAQGNATATTTLNDNYGSKIYCDELGFFLSNG
jgi:gamma-glutamyltranspeptidase/glutathione hydrolase